MQENVSLFFVLNIDHSFKIQNYETFWKDYTVINK